MNQTKMEWKTSSNFSGGNFLINMGTMPAKEASEYLTRDSFQLPSNKSTTSEISNVHNTVGITGSDKHFQQSSFLK